MGRNKKTQQPQKQVGEKSSDKQFLLCVIGTFLKYDDITAIAFENGYGSIQIQRKANGTETSTITNAIGFDIGSNDDDDDDGEEDDDVEIAFDDDGECKIIFDENNLDEEEYKKVVDEYVTFFE